MSESEPLRPGELPDDLERRREELDAFLARIDRTREISEQETRDFARILEGKSSEEIFQILTIMRGINALEKTLERTQDDARRKLCMQEINRFLVFLGLSERYPFLQEEK